MKVLRSGVDFDLMLKAALHTYHTLHSLNIFLPTPFSIALNDTWCKLQLLNISSS